MPEMTGDERQRFLDVLVEGARFNGYVVYEKDAREDLGTYLGGWSEQGVTKELLAYGQAGGKISRNQEKREGWMDKWKFCFHLWPTIGGQKLYFEARFDDRDADDPVIRIVRIHPP
ncbi:MAG: hypothetical protein WD403_13930 [Pirellulales bacterium]